MDADIGIAYIAHVLFVNSEKKTAFAICEEIIDNELSIKLLRQAINYLNIVFNSSCVGLYN